MKKKMIIIGAGISGLSLAYFLEKKYGAQLEITLIEKQERVGGSLRTFQNEAVLFEEGPRGFRPTGKGELTLQLAQELGLKVIYADPQVKERYIAHGSQLKKVGLGYLMRHCGLLPLLLEGCKKRASIEDESIASFFRHRLSKRYLNNLIYPLCQGIFAQDPEELSIQASFPLLRDRSLLRTFLALKAKKNTPPLCSFAEGMESLPKALAQRLHSPILLEKEVLHVEATPQKAKIYLNKNTLEADYLVLASGNLFALTPSFPQNRVSLTTVNLAFQQKILSKTGFGFLCKEQGHPFLGMTFDSNIFSEHNKAEQTRLCLMFKGLFSTQEIKQKTEGILSEYLEIKETPSHWRITTHKEALYQYPVGHVKKLKALEQSLPSSVILTGARFYGAAVNECINYSYVLSSKINF